MVGSFSLNRFSVAEKIADLKHYYRSFDRFSVAAVLSLIALEPVGVYFFSHAEGWRKTVMYVALPLITFILNFCIHERSTALKSLLLMICSIVLAIIWIILGFSFLDTSSAFLAVLSGSFSMINRDAER